MELYSHDFGGRGPTAVILHGLFGDGSNWRSLGTGWAARHHVVALDLRNHGRSPHGRPADLPALADDVRGWLQTHVAGPVDLLGHSLGGRVAMVVALTAPALVRSLVAVDIAARAYPPAHTGILAALQGLDLAAVDDRADADRQLAAMIPERAVRAFLLRNLRRDDGGWCWRLGLDEIAADYARTVIDVRTVVAAGARYHGPVLGVRGARSPYVQDDDMDAMRDLFPALHWQTIAGAGHWLHAEAPDALAAVVERFWNEAAGG